MVARFFFLLVITGVGGRPSGPPGSATGYVSSSFVSLTGSKIINVFFPDIEKAQINYIYSGCANSLDVRLANLLLVLLE